MISRDHFERAIVLLDQYLEQFVTGAPADSLLLAKALQYKSFCYYFINQPDLALKAVENALRIQRQFLSDEHFETGISLLYIGLIKTRSREYAFAWKCLQKSEEILKNTSHAHLQFVNYYDGYGLYFRDLKEYGKALENFEKSLLLHAEMDGKNSSRWRTLLYMGKVYVMEGNQQKAGDCFHEAARYTLQYFEGNHLGAGWANLELAYIMVQKQQSDSALVYAQRAIEIGEQYDTLHKIVADAGHQIGAIEAMMLRFSSAEMWLNKSKRIFEALNDRFGVARCNASLAIVYTAQSNIDEAEKMANEAIVTFRALPDAPNLSTSLRILSLIYRIKGNFKESDAAMEEARQYSEQTAADQIFFNQYEGMKSRFTGDHTTTIALFMKNLQDAIAVFGETSNETITALDDLADAYYHIGDCDQAEIYVKQILEIARKNPNIFSHLLFNVREDIASVYICNGKYEDAILVLHDILSAIADPDTFVTQDGYYQYIIYEYLHEAYFEQAKYDSALHYALRCLKTMNATGTNYFYTNSFDYVKLGNTYYALTKFDTALYYYRAAVNSYDVKPGSNSLFPSKKLNPNFVYALAGEASALFGSAPDSLFQSIDILENAMRYSDSLRSSFSEGSRLNFLSVRHFLTERKLCFLFQTGQKFAEYGMEIFDLMEKNKGVALQELINNQEAMVIAGIPPQTIEKYGRYRKRIGEVEKSIFESSTSGLQPSDSLTLTRFADFSAINVEYGLFLDSLSYAFPKYHKLKYDRSTLSLAYVQDTLLQPDQTLIEFFTGDSAVYIFAVRPDTFAVHQIKRGPDFPLDSLVRQMRHGLTDYYVSQSALPSYELSTARAYAQAAHVLYEKLIAPVAPLIPKNGNVIIAPDGVLGYVPFDALLAGSPENPERYYSHDYFGNHHPISYAYSATLLREMRDKQHKNPPGQPMLALAPFFQGNPDALLTWTDAAAEALGLSGTRDSISALPASGQEIKVVAGPFKGQTWYGAKATIDSFQRHAGQYRILHLSTHGKANDRVGDYAWLAFAQPGDTLGFDKFYVKDIYNLSLNADLVTLSACETGIGQLKRGEGIISLARAFAYAGAKSIVTTLWPVNDARTGELMRLFYRNLHKGMDKDTALWQAKKDFIQQHKKDGGAHPYFWSGFIPVGDMRKL